MKRALQFLHRVLASVVDLYPRIRPVTRRNEVASLRLRLVSEASAEELSPRERELALEMRAMREQMLRLIGDVQACRTCGKGYPPPNGRWDGGYCCGGTTENVFRQEELACLRASGTRPRDFKPPHCEHAGCSFRGPRGCSLPPVHRPNLCVRYACRMLNEEYESRGIAPEVKLLASKVQRAFHEFQALRAERIERESLAQLDPDCDVSSRKRGRRLNPERATPSRT